MLRGFWKLTWVEAKIFVREPLGVAGSLLIPLVLFVLMGRTFGIGRPAVGVADAPPFNVAVLAAILIAIGAVQSLVAIISIYREGGILKRLRATPLSPVTILGAHVAVKLGFTVVSLLLLIAAGRRLFPGVMQVNPLGFAAALLLGTLSILSLGFVIASVVPTARFAQPISTVVLYPLLAVSGLFVPLERFPPAVRMAVSVSPVTHAVALMQGVWNGSGWSSYWGNALALVVIFAVCTAVSSRVFRWE
jgi:ABC-2 type transport system permease protein